MNSTLKMLLAYIKNPTATLFSLSINPTLETLLIYDENNTLIMLFNLSMNPTLGMLFTYIENLILIM